MTPTDELRRNAHSLGGRLGNTQGDDRPLVHHDLTVAKLAYRLAKTIEELSLPFTQADADYLCEVMADRVSK